MLRLQDYEIHEIRRPYANVKNIKVKMFFDLLFFVTTKVLLLSLELKSNKSPIKNANEKFQTQKGCLESRQP